MLCDPDIQAQVRGNGAIAEQWFGQVDVDAFFLEYDSERAGGFASVAGGNVLTEDEQMHKLALVVETAQTVWGEA